MPAGQGWKASRSITWEADRSMTPQLTWLEPAPRPSSDRPASISTEAASSSVACTIREGAMLGRMWRHMMRRSDAPAARAPST